MQFIHESFSKIKHNKNTEPFINLVVLSKKFNLVVRDSILLEFRM